MTEFGFTMNAPAPKSRKPWIVLAGAAVVVALVAFVIAKSIQPPADYQGAGSGEVLVTVVKGDTGRAIGHRLYDAGVIASVEAWLAATANDARATKIAPGDYNMREKMSAADAFALILDPSARAYLKLVIPEGLRVKQIIERASDVSGIPVADFEAAVTDAKAIGLPSIANGNPEGFLFPATYEIGKNDKAADILAKMTKRWTQTYESLEMSRRASATGYTVYQLLTIASIVEVESGPKDYSKVARVIENRLKAPMRLQLDSTVNYALGISDLKLTSDQLKYQSPYNTYLNDGLPPGPIGNPGEGALEAVLEPASGSWLYFVTVDPENKITKFATTYEEFLVLKAEFQRNVR